MILFSFSYIFSDNVKVKSLYFTKYSAMRAYGGVEIQLEALFASPLDRVEWPSSCDERFTPVESPSYPLARRLCGPKSRCGHYEEQYTFYLF
jgi:hypothetical protein